MREGGREGKKEGGRIRKGQEVDSTRLGLTKTGRI